MIDINETLFINLLFVSFLLNGTMKLILGLSGAEKSNSHYYGIGDIIDGIICFGIVAAVLIW